MSRYRPIAPKPDLHDSTTTNGGGLVVPEKFQQSPYLRNIWSHLQARPTRTRKRAARSSTPVSPSILRNHHRRHHHKIVSASPSLNLSYPGFAIFDNNNNNNNNNNNEKVIVTLPLLSLSTAEGGMRNSIDLNSTAAAAAAAPVLEERDLLLQLQVPNNNTASGTVISPRPLRPVGSTISVMGPTTEDPTDAITRTTAEELEEAAEGEALPVVISDRNNKVRMANWAYKELVGQPECPWLDMTAMRSSSGKRIGGEVMINLPTEMVRSEMGNGFSCWVKIEWEREGKKSGVNAFCKVVKLVCESKDYMFSWRFHTREFSPSGSKVL